MTRTLIVLFFIMTSVSCSYVPKLDQILPDKRTEYKKSESLPDLEVPPDLTAEAGNDSMSIPNEGASLSAYQKRRSGGNAALQSVPAAATPESDEQWISVRGNNSNIWPRLRTFMSEQGYSLDLDDAELGVLETVWSDAHIEDGFSYRDKFKIFSEPGAEPGLTVLFISNQRQVLAKRQDGTDSWSDKEKSITAEKKLAGDLNLVFNGNREAIVSSTPVGGTQSNASPRKKTMVETTANGKDYLAIPEEFTRAWRHTEIALQRAGLPIAGKDQGSGVYNITYFDSAAGKEKGWLSKLKFWGGDEAPEGVPYQVSLTGVGDKTELIILNQAGEWETGNDALQIMAIIQSHLNKI